MITEDPAEGSSPAGGAAWEPPTGGADPAPPPLPPPTAPGPSTPLLPATSQELVDEAANRQVAAAARIAAAREALGLPVRPPAASNGSRARTTALPALISMGPSTTALLVGRALFVLAALLLGLAARRPVDRLGEPDTFWRVAAAAAVLGVVGVAGQVLWSVQLATNARRMSCRSASPRAAGWAWAAPVAWVVLASATFLRVDIGGEFDPFPLVAAVGFALTLALPVGRVQGIFRSLSRRPPVLWWSVYLFDVVAFGLIWWRLTSWPDPVTASDVSHIETTSAVCFAAAGILAANALVHGWVAHRGSQSVYERLSRVEARYRAADKGPQWFSTGFVPTSEPTATERRPLIGTRPLTAAVAALHGAWGLATILFAVLLGAFVAGVNDGPTFGQIAGIDGADVDRIERASGVVVLVYLVTIVVHGVWSVLVSLNARRVTVHAPHPGSFGLTFAPVPALVVAGVLVGDGTLGTILVLVGLGLAFIALVQLNQMLMALSGRLGGELRGFGRWSMLLVLVYVIGTAQIFAIAPASGRIGLLAASSFVQGAVVVAGAFVGYRAMCDLEDTLTAHRQVRRVTTPVV